MPNKAMHTKSSISHTLTHQTILNTYYLDDTRTTISTGAVSIIKVKIITMVTSLETDTNNILQITNLLNKCPMYTTDNQCNSQTLRNDDNFKSTPKDAVKDNRYRIHIYLNINNMHFKTSFKPEICEGIYEEP